MIIVGGTLRLSAFLVTNARLVWSRHDNGKPIVLGGSHLFATGVRNAAGALDPSNAKTLWKSRPLRVGKLADAIVVNGDPLASIHQLRRIETTIKDGVRYDTRALYATAGVTAPAITSTGCRQGRWRD